MERRITMAQMRVTTKSPPLIRLEPFRGINVSGSPTEISQNQSPDMLNFNLNEGGALNKRTGYERVVNMGTGPIKGMFLYRKSNGDEIFLLAHGGKLYQSGIPEVGVNFATWEEEDLTQTWESEV
jgi:hypothetical protein